MAVIGQMNRRIEIQRQSVSRDDYGSQVVSWQEVAKVWARVTQFQQGEDFENDADRIVAFRNARIRIRYRSDVDETMRLIYDDLPWDIKGIAEWGFRDQLELTCQTDVHRPEVGFTPIVDAGRVLWGASTLVTWGGDTDIIWRAI